MRWFQRISHCCRRMAMKLYSNDNFEIAFRLQKCCSICFKWMMRLLGPLMVLLALTMICSIYGVFLYVVLPTYESKTDVAVNFVIGTAFFVSILFFYLSCSLTPAGSPTPCEDPGALLGERIVYEGKRTLVYLNTRYELSPGVFYKFCSTCRAIKPPRAHHCSFSGKCIYHMDHFCPWVNNCVGYYNYRYFYLFLAYLVVACIYGMFITRNGLYILLGDGEFNISYWDKDTFDVYIFTILLAVFLSVGILLCIHTFLLLTNQTTIELYINWAAWRQAIREYRLYKNPFDAGWRKNLHRVFGDTFPWYWSCLPVWVKLPEPEYPFDLASLLDNTSDPADASHRV